MLEIQNPFGIKGIPLKPELKGRLKVDETLIQSLAAIMGFDGEARRLITCAMQGSLHVVGPPVVEIVNYVASGDGEVVSWGDIPTTEIMMMTKTGNSSNVTVNVGAIASGAEGWKMAAGGMVTFPINNMRLLSVWTALTNDKFVIMRTA